MSLVTKDPLTQLAFAIFQNQGVFAVLVGSGLSRAAEIPTGWEITTDLIRRVGLARGEEEQTDWAAWYKDSTGYDVNYSSIIQELGTSPEQRRSILHSYIEPTSEDRENGRRVPTSAHIAIANLVESGFIKVIITTNFDRLMETALRERGIEPTIVGSVDALLGAEPLAHTRCYLLKLHGDYKDARILNTDDELSEYPKQINKLLDRIFDEYGLIIVGWSGEWDTALRSALMRNPSRRYPTFWLARGSVTERARDLINHRKAQVITIESADGCFSDLSRRLESLKSTSRQNPLTIELLVATVKRYLPKPELRIELNDLIVSEVAKLSSTLNRDDLKPGHAWSHEEIIRRVNIYEAATEPLARVFGSMGRWGEGGELRLVVETLRALYTEANEPGGGLVAWLGLRSYPAVLVFFAYGIGLTRAARWESLHSFLHSTLSRNSGNPERMVDGLYSWNWRGYDQGLWNVVEPKKKTPLSEHLLKIMSEWSPSFIDLTPDFEALFEKFELLASLVDLEKMTSAQLSDRLSKQAEPVGMAVGRVAWDHRIRAALISEFQSQPLRTSLAAAGFGGRSELFMDLFAENMERLAQRSFWW